MTAEFTLNPLQRPSFAELGAMAIWRFSWVGKMRGIPSQIAL